MMREPGFLTLDSFSFARKEVGGMSHHPTKEPKSASLHLSMARDQMAETKESAYPSK